MAAAIAVKPAFYEEPSEKFQTAAISLCGELEVELRYALSVMQLQVTIVEARNLPSKDRGSSDQVQVCVLVSKYMIQLAG